jgi:hypothetical protein
MSPDSLKEYPVLLANLMNNSSAILCVSATSAFNKDLRTRLHRFVSLCLAVILAVLLVPDAALTQTKSQGEQVPAVLLKRLGAQYVPEDDQTQGLTCLFTGGPSA